jgi:hypothetical protein
MNQIQQAYGTHWMHFVYPMAASVQAFRYCPHVTMQCILCNRSGALWYSLDALVDVLDVDGQQQVGEALLPREGEAACV